ncbi:hypothetical protein HN747_00730 [archaeon]|nr:hypothetical protein [archaeon]
MEQVKWFNNWIVWAGVIVFLVIVWLAGPRSPEGEWDTFAQCLSDADAVMYGTEWCSHCQDQKELFGDSFDNINFVDCDRSRDVCVTAGVSGYPTWKIKGQNYPGGQSLYRLSELSGCELIKDTE